MRSPQPTTANDRALIEMEQAEQVERTRAATECRFPNNAHAVQSALATGDLALLASVLAGFPIPQTAAQELELARQAYRAAEYDMRRTTDIYRVARDAANVADVIREMAEHEWERASDRLDAAQKAVRK